jgi:hypothetical protein
MSDEDAVALRREWEQQQADDIAESRRRYHAEMARRDRLEEAGEQLRGELGTKLVALMESLESYVDGTQGDVTAAMVSVYVKAAHELAMLYNLTRAARPVSLPLPLPEPDAVLDAASEGRQRAAAVEAARAAGLAQLEAVKEKMLEATQRKQLNAS